MAVSTYRVIASGVLLLVAVSFCASCGGGGSGSKPRSAFVTLAWEAPSTRADGTPLLNLAGYKLYEGSESRMYTSVTDVGDITLHTVEVFTEGPHYYAVTAYDTEGFESEFSDEVLVVTPLE